MMSVPEKYRYPQKALVADYLRASIGVFLPVALMLFTDLLPLVFYIMAALVVLFGFYGLRTIWRQGTVLVVDDDGVRQEGPLGGLLDRRIGWSEMCDFRLRYYSTRRDGSDGWMNLVLRGPKRSPYRFGAAGGGRIRLDSNLPGFDDVVARTHAAAVTHGLEIDRTSATNLASLGFGTDEERAAAAVPSTPLDTHYRP
jgi:hypothetical protein